MKNKINIYLSILIILLSFTFVLSVNQYYLADYGYSEDGSVFNGILEFRGNFDPDDYNYNWTNRESELLQPIDYLNISISLECDQYLHIYVKDASKERWENTYSISDEYRQKVQSCFNKTTKTLDDFGLSISLNMDEPFYINLTNPSTGELVFTTQNTDFLYTDVFIGFAGYFTSNDVYGFGERYHDLKLGDGKFTMWPNDTIGIHEDTGEGGHNAMGIHPLGFHRTKQNSFIGLLFNNINAQDLVIKSNQSYYYNDENDNNVLIEHLTIGGVIDYYITISDTPDRALISLHDIIGHPLLPPFWALGFHQCRWGYKKTQQIRNVYESYMGYELPIDTFWGDIDILQDFHIFTLNTQDFPDLPNLIAEMHEKNYKFVPIADIGFAMDDTDEYYNRGVKNESFIKSNYTNDNLLTFVWPGDSVFPDFLSPAGEDLWSYAMEKYYQTVKYDGIWLDMNEPAMTQVDEPDRGEILVNGTFDPEKNYYEYIPYVPGYREDHSSIRARTLSENCYSKLLSENNFYVGYNFKPLMSYLETKITNEQLINLQNRRPFILSRSTALGHGKYGYHWLGDNGSNYAFMQNGLNGIFQFQIYGVPITGDDICGFMGDAWDELCARWMTMGAFFPFSRNHNMIGQRSQEPYAFGKDSYTLASSKLALNMRYSLLRYYYSELFKVSIGEAGSFFKPLFFNYFSDENTYVNVSESFMVGDALLIYPIFKNETDDVEVYLPQDDWFTYPEGVLIRNQTEDPGMIIVSGEFNRVNIFVRGGSIFPHQDTFHKVIMNTFYLHKEKTDLVIVPDTTDSHIAAGDIFFDNDEYDTLATANYYHIKFSFIYDTLLFENRNVMDTSYTNQDIYVSKLHFYNMGYLNQDGLYDMARVKYRNGKIANVHVAYLPEDNVLIDLSSLNAKFYEIVQIRFFKNNDN